MAAHARRISEKWRLQFLKNTKFNNLPLEFCKDFGAPAKKHFSLAGSDRYLVGRTSYEGIWRCPLNLPQQTADCSRTVPQPCFSKVAAEDLRSDQSSSV